jgi:hypothetical protein
MLSFVMQCLILIGMLSVIMLSVAFLIGMLSVMC